MNGILHQNISVIFKKFSIKCPQYEPAFLIILSISIVQVRHPWSLKRKAGEQDLENLVCLCMDLDGESIIGLSPHPAGEQLWDVWGGEAGFLD